MRRLAGRTIGRLVRVCEQIGREHHRVHRREHDGAARGEAIGRRAGRGRDDQPVGPVAGGELPVDRHLQTDDAAHRRLGDDHVVERGVLGEPLALAGHLAASIMRSSMTSSSRRQDSSAGYSSSTVSAVEEAEAAQVDAEDGHAEVAHEARHGQQRAVAAEDEQEIHLPRQVGLPRRRARPRRGTAPPSPCRAPACSPRAAHHCEQSARTTSLASSRSVFATMPIRFMPTSDSAVWAMSASRSDSVRPVLVRWRKNSRLPLGPLSGER